MQVLPGLRGQGTRDEAEAAVLESAQGEARIIKKCKHCIDPLLYNARVLTRHTQESKEAYFVALKRKPYVNL